MSILRNLVSKKNICVWLIVGAVMFLSGCANVGILPDFGDLFALPRSVLPPPALNPPALNPPALNPPALNPPALNPPVLNPPVLNPPVLNPPVLNPPVLNPPVLNPPALNPPVPKTPVPKLSCLTGYTLISNRVGLEGIGSPLSNLSGNYCLEQDIDLAGADWVPLGSLTTPFTGNLEGNGHRIYNLTINNPIGDYQGLFAVMGNAPATSPVATVKNLRIEVGQIVGSGKVGALVGMSRNSTITQVNITGGTIKGEESVGGLVGWSYATDIDASFSAVAVEGRSWIGGLTGYNGGSITDSGATGNITGGQGGHDIGGLVGSSWGFGKGTIKGSYATGNVTAGERNNHTGGLLGFGDAIIVDSYATGEVIGFYSVGGLVGKFTAGTITRSYASGKVTSTLPAPQTFQSGTGGLVGSVAGTQSITTPTILIEDSYATGEVSSVAGSVGGLLGAVGWSTDSFYKITIATSYATGKVTGATTGGLIGAIMKHLVHMTHTYYDSITTGQTQGIGSGVVDVLTSVPTTGPTGILEASILQNTFTSLTPPWSSMVWNFSSNSWPAF